MRFTCLLIFVLIVLCSISVNEAKGGRGGGRSSGRGWGGSSRGWGGSSRGWGGASRGWGGSSTGSTSSSGGGFFSFLGRLFGGGSSSSKPAPVVHHTPTYSSPPKVYHAPTHVVHTPKIVHPPTHVSPVHVGQNNPGKHVHVETKPLKPYLGAPPQLQSHSPSYPVQSGHHVSPPSTPTQHFVPGQTIVFPTHINSSPSTGQIFKEALIHSAVDAGVRRVINGPHHHHSHHYYHNGQGNSGSHSEQPNGGSSVTNNTTIVNNYYGGNSSNPNTTQAPSTKDEHVAVNNKTSTPPLEYYVSDANLTELTERLFSADQSHLKRFVELNLQNKTKIGEITEEAQKPLMSIGNDLYNQPTVRALRDMFDNYQINSTLEDNSAAPPKDKLLLYSDLMKKVEGDMSATFKLVDLMVRHYADPDFVRKQTFGEDNKKEQDHLIDTFFGTEVMKTAVKWLTDKGYLKERNRKQQLKDIWFTAVNGTTSGFERIFLAEIYPGANLLGAQNWIYFATKEASKDIDYMGYTEMRPIAEKASLLKLNFKMGEAVKQQATMLVGTSPELEMALYTVCYFTRPNDICPVSLGGTKFDIYTHSFRYSDKDIIDLGILAI